MGSNEEASSEPLQVEGSKLLNMFYALLKQSKLETLEENLEFMFSNEKSGFSFFSKIAGLQNG